MPVVRNGRRTTRTNPTTQPMRPIVNWLTEDDLPALFELQSELFGPGNSLPSSRMATYLKINPNICMVVRNPNNLSELYGFLKMYPVRSEDTLYRLAANGIVGIDLSEEEVESYDRPGGYYLYTAVAFLPEWSHWFLDLVSRYLAWWLVEQYPKDRTIDLVGAHAISPEGFRAVSAYDFRPIVLGSDAGVAKGAYILSTDDVNNSNFTVRNFSHAIGKISGYFVV